MIKSKSQNLFLRCLVAGTRIVLRLPVQQYASTRLCRQRWDSIWFLDSNFLLPCPTYHYASEAKLICLAKVLEAFGPSSITVG